MNIKEQVLTGIVYDTDIIKHLTMELQLTTEEVKNLLIRYAFNKLVLLEDVTNNNEVADVLKRKYMVE